MYPRPRIRRLGIRLREVGVVRVNWSLIETMLAPDVYLRCGDVSKSHPEVRRLSAILRATAPNEADADPKFRSDSSVAKKLANIAA